jgi:hypothetical protein
MSCTTESRSSQKLAPGPVRADERGHQFDSLRFCMIGQSFRIIGMRTTVLGGSIDTTLRVDESIRSHQGYQRDAQRASKRFLQAGRLHDGYDQYRPSQERQHQEHAHRKLLHVSPEFSLGIQRAYRFAGFIVRPWGQYRRVLSRRAGIFVRPFHSIGLGEHTQRRESADGFGHQNVARASYDYGRPVERQCVPTGRHTQRVPKPTSGLQRHAFVLAKPERGIAPFGVLLRPIPHRIGSTFTANTACHWQRSDCAINGRGATGCGFSA